MTRRVIVDVSGHQSGSIDFGRVRREHPEVVGVIVKATEGVTFVDPMFTAHVRDAQAAGLLTGCYTFVRPANVGTGDMQKFLDVAAPFEMKLGYWLDVEADDGVDPATLLARVLEKAKFVAAHQSRTGFYTGAWFWNPKTKGSTAAHVEQWPLWLSGYSATMPAPPPPWTNALLWQFTDAYDTHIGPVDASSWQGTDEQWADWTASPTPTPPPGGHVRSVTGKNMDRLHPVFAAQLQQLADLAGHDIYAQSTGRTDAEQDVFYQGWLKRQRWNGGGHTYDARNPYSQYSPANPPGGPSWHRYRPGIQHAQAADISTVGLGGATARSVFGPHAAKVGLSFAIASESWHIQPTAKHSEVPFGTVPVPTAETEFIVDDLDFRPGLKAYPSPRSLSATVMQAALARHGEWIVLPGATPAPTLKQIQGALGDFQTSHLGSSDLIVGSHTKAALAVEPRNCPTCKRLGRYPYK